VRFANFFTLLFLAVPLWTAHARDNEVPVPEFHRRVTDLSGTLSEGEAGNLEAALAGFEQSTSNQIAVLIIPSLNGEGIEDYSMRVAERNKFGKKGRDNGVLLVIAKDDRLMRIEVGYGLEGVLTDALCDQIIRRVIAPKFRQGNYAEGIDAGINAIMLATKGEFKGTPGGNFDIRHFTPLFFILVFIVFGIISRFLGGGRRHYVGSRGYTSRGIWFGGFGGGGFGGGGFGGGGGGFSGGGGSFGGGGASGSW
jgi:uncharacterized protein